MNLRLALIQCILCFTTYKVILAQSEESDVDIADGYESLDPDNIDQIDADSLVKEEPSSNEMMVQTSKVSDTIDGYEWLDPDNVHQIDVDSLTEEETSILSERLTEKIKRIQGEIEEMKERMAPFRTNDKVQFLILALETELIEDYLKEEKILSYFSRRCREIFKYCQKTNMVKRGIALFNLCSRPVKQVYFRLSNVYVYLSRTVLKFF